jgi:hypothetical protein
LDAALKQHNIVDPAVDRSVPKLSISKLRSGRGRPVVDPTRMASLVNIDGVLIWKSGLLSSPRPGFRAFRRGFAGVAEGEVIKRVRFEELPPNDIAKFWDNLDDVLTPRDPATKQRGLLEWKDGKLIPVNLPPQNGQMLLIVHGTFSNSKNFLDSLAADPNGKTFLEQAKKRYPAGIFAFDHPTLSATPLENAVDLARVFGSSKAEVDVLAHSRGGLVTRWWFESLSPELHLRRKAVLVGCPLAGTSLAAPPQWKSLMNYLTNLSSVLGAVTTTASFAAPCLSVATGLLKFFGTATNLVAKTPLADAAVSLIPGLNGQSRVGNSPGLQRLRLTTCDVMDRYCAVTSDFEPDPIGWRFWRFFNDPTGQVLNAAADALFNAPNDLVVDTISMTDLRDNLKIPGAQTLEIGKNPKIHHVNYFSHPPLYAKLNEWLLADGH